MDKIPKKTIREWAYEYYDPEKAKNFLHYLEDRIWEIGDNHQVYQVSLNDMITRSEAEMYCDDFDCWINYDN